jgi:hypothetical protein
MFCSPARNRTVLKPIVCQAAIRIMASRAVSLLEVHWILGSISARPKPELRNSIEAVMK